MTDAPIPSAALRLGLAGLIPFVAMLAAMAMLPDWLLLAVGIGIAYGAVILSFVGGAWWGIAAARAEGPVQARLLALAILPSFPAWLALLLPPVSALVLLGLSFLALLPADARLARDGLAPGWWFALRRLLSTAMAALHLAMAGLLMLSGPAFPG